MIYHRALFVLSRNLSSYVCEARRMRRTRRRFMEFEGFGPSDGHSSLTVLINTYRRMEIHASIASHACFYARACLCLCRVGSSDFLLSRDVCSSEHTRGP